MIDNNDELIEAENNLLGILNSIVDSNASDEKELRILKRKDFIDKFKIFKETIKNSKAKSQKKGKFDVVIFTIVPIEFEYANHILKFMGENDFADFSISGLGYHKFEINRVHKHAEPLKCVIALVGKAGDINCALTCIKFFNDYDCDLAILCGIAAGVEGEVEIYSPVVASNIINYEFQRLEQDGIEYRPIPYNLPEERFNESTEMLKKSAIINALIKKNIAAFNASDPILDNEKINKIEFKRGVIGSGAKLLADTKTIQTLRKNIPIEKGIIAVEMEGSGFVPACQMFKKNWMVFRGISDYGQSDKDNPLNKEFQKFAVISAITTMKYYLENLFEIDGNKPF